MNSGQAWISSLFRDRPWVIAILVGALVGVMLLIDVSLPVLAMGFIIAAFIGLTYPELLIPLLFVSIFAEESGRIELLLAGVQLTLSKLMVLAMIGVALVRSISERRSVIEWLPTTWGYLAVIASMVFGIAVAGKMAPPQLITTLSVILLTVLAHLVPRLVPATRVRWVVRLISLMAIVVLLTNVSATPIETAYQERYTGAYLDPNIWAMTLLLVTPLCIANMAEEDSPWWTLLLVLMLGLVLVNVFQSLSRAGLIGLLCIAPVLIWLCWPRRWAFAAAIAVTALGVTSFVSLDAMSDRYATLVDPDMTEKDGSLQLRSLLARTAWRVWLDHPIIGTGQGTFIEQAIRYTDGAAYMISHNTYLNIAAELGLVGILTHAFFYFLVVREGVNAAFRAPTRRLRRLIVGYGAGLLSFALISVTLNTMQFTMAYFMVGLGTVLARVSHLSREELSGMGLGDKDAASPDAGSVQAA